MSVTVRKAAPQIFRRPLLFVGPDDPMLQVATFLATGLRLYVDGLVVLDGERLAGRIGGRALSDHILKAKERWLDARASDIAEKLDWAVDADGPLAAALEIFKETRFAFVPVASGGRVVASLSIRDLLGFAGRSAAKVAPLASPVVTIDEKMGVSEALRFMVEKEVRNLVARRRDGYYVVNDRKMLEFLLSHDARELVSRRGFEEGLSGVRVSSLCTEKGREVGPGVTAGSAARLLSELGTPCLFVKGKILTPWDIVMKTR
jgi:CBS domain-containing protein